MGGNGRFIKFTLNRKIGQETAYRRSDRKTKLNSDHISPLQKYATETTLWSGELRWDSISNSITLSDNMSNYKYIDIYTNASGAYPAFRYPASYTYFEAKIMNVANNLTDIGIEYNELRLNKISDTILQMHEDSWVKWSWDGIPGNAPKKTRTTTAFISAIVGVHRII